MNQAQRFLYLKFFCQNLKHGIKNLKNWAQTYTRRFNQFFQNWDGRFCQKGKKTNIGTSFSREPHVWILTLNFVSLGSLGTSLSLIFQIYKPYSSGCGTFFQIPKSSGPIQKRGPISFTGYTLLKIAYWIDMELYDKLKLQNTEV